MSKTRTMRDSMGEIEVAEDRFWGAQTQRSVENFRIGDERMPKALIQALVEVKKCAAVANEKTGMLSKKRADAIVLACETILSKGHYDHFPLVVWQTGSGTQTNMNANEVIAHLANESSEEGVHPNDHVNCSQSSNDVFPSAMHVAFVCEVEERLKPAIQLMREQLAKLERENTGILKTGRTHLQDATPIAFSQEISGWTSGLVHAEKMIELALCEMRELAMGGTAVGTGLNATHAFVEAFMVSLNEAKPYNFSQDENKFHALATLDAEVFLSGALKALAANLMKMANDIRLLASGPRCGFGEITIPSNEPGSSIMPGKVNPTQSESMTMVATQVMGNDTTIGICASQGNFELNVFMPVVAYNLLQSISLLADAIVNFTEKCLIGLVANVEKMRENLDKSLMLVTALNRHIGYENGAKIAKIAFAENKTLKEVAVKLALLTPQQYDEWVRPEEMV